MRNNKRGYYPEAAGVSHAVICMAACLISIFNVDALADASQESSRPESQSFETETDDVIEVRATQPKDKLPILDQDSRILYSGESLARLFENHPQFWVERRSASPMDTRVYIDGLGPERTHWTLDGHPMSDLSVVGWQVSDVPVSWIQQLDMRLGADAYLDARTFRPSLALTSKRATENRQISGELGLGVPRDHGYRLDIQEGHVGRFDGGYRSRFGGRMVYDDRGTWYTSEDDRVVNLSSERTERVSLQHQQSFEFLGTSRRLDWTSFSLADRRSGPASLRSDELQIDASRQGLFTGVRLVPDQDGWGGGINYFYATRRSNRKDFNGSLLQEVRDSYHRSNAWSRWFHQWGNQEIAAELLGTTTSRSQNDSKVYNEFISRALWRYGQEDGDSLFCALEWLQAQSPSETWLSEPMGDCGIRGSRGTFQGSWSVGYTVRRPTWVEWFGDGIDLLANAMLKPERGAGTSLRIGWTPTRTFSASFDGRLRAGNLWITWVPSSFSTRKAVNLGEFQQALLGLSARWRPIEAVDIRSMLRAAWARERAEGRRWTELTQEAPLRLISQFRYQPLEEAMVEMIVDWAAARPLDRQNVIFTGSRPLFHGALLWEPTDFFVVSLTVRNLLNRLSTVAQSSSGAALEVAEMGGLGFPISGREIMLTLRLKELEDL